MPCSWYEWGSPKPRNLPGTCCSDFGKFVLEPRLVKDKKYGADAILYPYSFEKLVARRVLSQDIQIPHLSLCHNICLGMELLDILLDQYFALSISMVTCFFWSLLGDLQPPTYLNDSVWSLKPIERLIPWLLGTNTAVVMELFLYVHWPLNYSKPTIL